MLKSKSKIIAIFLTLILLFSSTIVFADNETDLGVMPISIDSNSEVSDPITNEIESNTQTQSKEDSYKKSDVYLAGDHVTIDYIIDGNLFVCADTVTIDSQIGGDAFIIAKKVIVNENAYIFNNLFAISNSIEIKGIIYDVYALAQNFTISNGYIHRDLKLSCNTLTVNGAVGRNAFVDCSNVQFNTDKNDKGIIYGDFNYSANSEISIDSKLVNGNIKYSQSSMSSQKSIGAIIASYLLDLGAFLSFVLIIWLICLLLAPKFLKNTNNFVGKKTLGILGYGLLSLIIIPVVCIILIFLQLTSGISLVLLTLYILALAISSSLFTITANNYLCSRLKIDKTSGIFGMLIVSGIVIWILTKIPYVGGLLSFIITAIGLGILVVSILPKKLISNSSTENIEKTKKTTKVEKNTNQEKNSDEK